MIGVFSFPSYACVCWDFIYEERTFNREIAFVKKIKKHGPLRWHNIGHIFVPSSHLLHLFWYIC